MVTISKGQEVAETPGLRVFADSGDYPDTSLILCAEDSAPSVPTALLQAQFIAYGAIVYRFETPEELGAAIYALHPQSTLDAVTLYKEQIARDAARSAGTLEPENPVEAPDSPEPLADTEAVPEEKAPEPDEPAPAEPALPEPSLPEPPADTGTTTEDRIIDPIPGGEIPDEPTVAGTSTEPVVPEPEPPAVDLSTTTPE